MGKVNRYTGEKTFLLYKQKTNGYVEGLMMRTEFNHFRLKFQKISHPLSIR